MQAIQGKGEVLRHVVSTERIYSHRRIGCRKSVADPKDRVKDFSRSLYILQTIRVELLQSVETTDRVNGREAAVCLD